MLEKSAGALALEAQERNDRLGQRSSQIGVRHAEPAEAFLGQVDPAQREIPGGILEEIDELEGCAHRVAHRNELRLLGPSVDSEDEPTDGVGGVRAVIAHLRPRLIAGLRLVDPVCLDESREGLTRQSTLGDRLMQPAHDLRPWGAVELVLQLVEQSAAVAFGFVPEVVDEPREPVDRPQVRSRPARRQERRDRKVLPRRPRVDSLRSELRSLQ